MRRADRLFRGVLTGVCVCVGGGLEASTVRLPAHELGFRVTEKARQAMYVKHTTEGRSCNHCRSGQGMSHILSMCL